MLKSAKTLTDLTLKSLPEGLHFDAKLPSFGIRVGKRRKTWLVVKGANRTKVSLGHYPALSLQEARRRAHLALGTPHAPREAPTFPEALKTFLSQDHWRQSSKYVLEKSLRRYCTWTCGLDKITHADVAKVIDAIPTIGARRTVLKDIKTFFNWCVPRYIDRSPCEGLKAPPYVSRERVLSDEELKRVWIAAGEIDSFGVIVKILVLTGLRRGEVASLKNEWITEKKITLPSEVTKNKREHVFPIGTLAYSLLSSRMNKSESFLFPARSKTKKPYNGWGKHLKLLQEKSETSDWTLHDLRRTFSTNMARLGVPIHVTEKLLNHVSGSLGGVAGIYNRHAYWEEMQQAIQKWEDKIRSLCPGAT